MNFMNSFQKNFYYILKLTLTKKNNINNIFEKRQICDDILISIQKNSKKCVVSKRIQHLLRFSIFESANMVKNITHQNTELSYNLIYKENL